MNQALLNLPHLSGIYKQGNSASHLNNPASVTVNSLANDGKRLNALKHVYSEGSPELLLSGFTESRTWAKSTSCVL